MPVEWPNDGLVSALNEGIESARAEFIARMDADDVAIPERFALQHARMVKEPELAVLGSLIRWMDRVGNIIELANQPLTPKAIARCLEQGGPVARPSVIMRRGAVLKVGGYRKAFPHAEDYDLWLAEIPCFNSKPALKKENWPARRAAEERPYAQYA